MEYIRILRNMILGVLFFSSAALPAGRRIHYGITASELAGISPSKTDEEKAADKKASDDKAELQKSNAELEKRIRAKLSESYMPYLQSSKDPYDLNLYQDLMKLQTDNPQKYQEAIQKRITPNKPSRHPSAAEISENEKRKARWEIAKAQVESDIAIANADEARKNVLTPTNVAAPESETVAATETKNPAPESEAAEEVAEPESKKEFKQEVKQETPSSQQVILANCEKPGFMIGDNVTRDNAQEVVKALKGKANLAVLTKEEKDLKVYFAQLPENYYKMLVRAASLLNTGKPLDSVPVDELLKNFGKNSVVKWDNVILGTQDEDLDVLNARLAGALDSLVVWNSVMPIKQLELCSRRQSNITIPATLTSLQTLSIAGYTTDEALNGVIDQKILNDPILTVDISDKLTALDSLSISHTQLNALKIPDTLINLEQLTVSNNKLTGFRIPPTLTNLIYIKISGNPIKKGAVIMSSELVNKIRAKEVILQ